MDTKIHFKVCQSCKQEQPVFEFHKNKWNSDGLQVACRACVKRLNKLRDLPPAPYLVQEKYCPVCETKKPAQDFQRNRMSKDKLGSQCKACLKAYFSLHASTKTVKEKLCNTCKQVKPAAEMGRKRRAVDGLDSRCKECRRAKNLFSFYRITHQQYEEQFQLQKGLCAICSKPSLQPLAVDHNHATGILRELLCNSCNLALGLLQDDKKLCLSVAEYLTKHESGDGVPEAFRAHLPKDGVCVVENQTASTVAAKTPA